MVTLRNCLDYYWLNGIHSLSYQSPKIHSHFFSLSLSMIYWNIRWILVEFVLALNKAINLWMEASVYVCVNCIVLTMIPGNCESLLQIYYICWINFGSVRAWMCWGVIFYAMSINTIFPDVGFGDCWEEETMWVCVCVVKSRFFQLPKVRIVRNPKNRMSCTNHSGWNAVISKTGDAKLEWNRLLCRWHITMQTKTSMPRGNLIPIYDRFILLLHDSYFMLSFLCRSLSSSLFHSNSSFMIRNREEYLQEAKNFMENMNIETTSVETTTATESAEVKNSSC